MALADRLQARRARRRPTAERADPISLEEFGYLLAGKQQAPGVTATGALGIPAWYRGAVYLSSTIAALPVHAYRTGPGDTRERRARPPWLAMPDTGTPWHAWAEHAVMSLLHRGNSYSWKLRGPSGQVIGLRPIHADRVRAGRSSDGLKVFEIDRGPEPWTGAEVLHIPGPSYDGTVGLDPIRTHAASLGLIQAAETEAAGLFGTGSRLRAYISLPGRLAEGDADRLREQWQTLHEGLNAKRFGVLGDGAEYHTVGLDPQQAQLLESRNYGVLEVARIIGLPPHKLYDLSRATFSNIEHQAIETVTDSIRPWVARIEAHINADPDLVGDRFIEIELDGLLRGDTATRYEAYSKAIGRPWLAPNEARRLENRPPREHGDELAVPLNMALGPAEPAPLGPLELVTAIQKVYLGVGKVLTAGEAREILNRLGADLTGELGETA